MDLSYIAGICYNRNMNQANSVSRKQKKSLYYVDLQILIPYLALSIIGLIMVYSTTSSFQIQNGGRPVQPLIMQFIFWVLSLFSMYVLYRMSNQWLKETKAPVRMLMALPLLLVIARFVPGAMFAPRNGAYGWISLGPVTLQPAEYIKFFMIWYLASYFYNQQENIYWYDHKALTTGSMLQTDWRLLVLSVIASIVILPDFGNASIVLLEVIILFCVSGVSRRWFSVLLSSVVGIAVVGIATIAIVGPNTLQKIPGIGYTASRFSAFLNPLKDETGAGTQLLHSHYAMVNGGWTGRGLGNSIEKNGFLPEAHTDFAFSITMEELGLIGAILILGLLFYMIMRLLIAGINAKDSFNGMILLGVAGFLLIQTFINIGGISGLIPATGVTFPFLSQGGNSLLTISAAIGLALSVEATETRLAEEGV